MDRGEVKMTKLPVADINVACEASRPAAPTEGSHANPWEPLQKVFFPAEIEMGKTVCLPKVRSVFPCCCCSASNAYTLSEFAVMLDCIV